MLHHTAFICICTITNKLSTLWNRKRTQWAHWTRFGQKGFKDSFDWPGSSWLNWLPWVSFWVAIKNPTSTPPPPPSPKTSHPTHLVAKLVLFWVVWFVDVEPRWSQLVLFRVVTGKLHPKWLNCLILNNMVFAMSKAISVGLKWFQFALITISSTWTELIFDQVLRCHMKLTEPF